MEQEIKCICGYEIEKEWDKEPIKGDELFIPISSIAGFTMPNPKEMEYGDYNYNLNVNIDLYACPKCGTVKMIYDEYR